jgi:hypothetical protein
MSYNFFILLEPDILHYLFFKFQEPYTYDFVIKDDRNEI